MSLVPEDGERAYCEGYAYGFHRGLNGAASGTARRGPQQPAHRTGARGVPAVCLCAVCGLRRVEREVSGVMHLKWGGPLISCKS